MNQKIAVVIPCYCVTGQVLEVIANIGMEVSAIFAVDDCCPEGSGDLITKNCDDARVVVLRHPKNMGVGGAVMTGYRAAIDAGADVIVKVDGDGQMDPGLIPVFIEPIVAGEADYTKGNRFFDLENIRAMPKTRIFGNAVLSFMTKLSSGYWHLFDPTNGYTAIHADVARRLPFEKISRGYFFETDILFRLGTLRAVVVDVPMDARYGDEVSNLKITKIAGMFFFKHVRNFFKRIFYNYYLRDMSLASIELLFVCGGIFGVYHWINSVREGITTPAGTVMLAALPVLMGAQMVLAFLGYDIANVPSRPLHKMLQT
jgi:glycosyltransferase involved in cell wall biosynthesis